MGSGLSGMEAGVVEQRRWAPARGVWSLHPAHYWDEAFLVGNGVMRALVFGGHWSETVALTHERMLIPRWREPPRPPVIAPALPEVRRLLRAGHFDAANALAIQAAIADGYPASIGAAGLGIPTNERHWGLVLHFSGRACRPVSGYMRTVDFQTGVSTVYWTDDRGPWVRRVFASRADDVVAIEVAPPSGSVFAVDIAPGSTLSRGQERETERGRWAVPKSLSLRCEFDRDCMAAVGHYPGVEGSGYTAAVRLAAPGGSVCWTGGRLCVEGARSLLVLARIRAGVGDARKDVESLRLLELDFELLLARHRPLHGAIFGRSRLDLEGGGGPLSAEDLVAAQRRKGQPDPRLLQRLYDLGRYYLIAVTGSWPSIWGHININVNLQVSGMELCGMPELMEAYFRWIESLQDDFRVNARSVYGFRGVLAATHPDEESGLLYHFARRWPHHYWVSGAGWSLAPFWEHYQFTGDREFARTRIFPLLREVARFYEDYLTETEPDGRLVFVPSFSPENHPGNVSGLSPVVLDAAMDVEVCREVLTRLIELCQTFGVEQEHVRGWQALIDRLPPLEIDTTGVLREWCAPELRENCDHRHVSHLYGVWPGDQITPDSTPALADAARLANRRRGEEDGSAHGIMHRALVAARLRDAALATRLLHRVLSRGYLVPANLTTLHYPGRLPCPDAGCSIPTLLAEMLIQSRPGVVELLPALPAALPRGIITGIALRTGATAEKLTWDTAGGTVELRMRSRSAQEIIVVLDRGIRGMEARGTADDGARRLDGRRWVVRLPADTTAEIHLEIEGPAQQHRPKPRQESPSVASARTSESHT